MVSLPAYFTRTMNKETESLTESNLTTIEHSLDSYFDELERLTFMPYFNKDFMNSILMVNSDSYSELDEYAKFKLTQSINYTLSNSLGNTREDILSALFVTTNAHVYATAKKNDAVINDDFPFIASSWYKQAVKANSKITYIDAHTQEQFLQPYPKQVFSVARLIKDPVTQKRLGVLLADVDTNILGLTFRGVNLGVHAIISVFDASGQIVFTTDPLSKSLQSKAITADGAIIKGTSDSYLVINRNLEQLPWRIQVLLSQSELKAKIKDMYIVGGLIILLELSIIFLMFFIVSSRIIKPFNHMITTIRTIETGAFTVQFDETGKDEIAYLSHNLNQMINHINDLVTREYKVILEKQKAEYHALQSQIQPHFLYNTLNGIIGLNRKGEKQKVEQTILNLSQMLRYILNQEDYSTLSSEMNLLSNYCALQKLRFSSRINFEISLADDIGDFMIPKLLLQPIVENAIIHGLEPLQDHGILSILAQPILFEDASFIEILIEDNGIGFDLNTVDLSNSVGLTNAKNRLALTYTNYHFEIKSALGKGTSVKILIPYDTIKEEIIPS